MYSESDRPSSLRAPSCGRPSLRDVKFADTTSTGSWAESMTATDENTRHKSSLDRDAEMMRCSVSVFLMTSRMCFVGAACLLSRPRCHTGPCCAWAASSTLLMGEEVTKAAPP